MVLFFSHKVPAQSIDTTIKASTILPWKVSGNVQATNNGISLFPTFTLGKPAAILDLSIGKKNFYLEPQLRFGLDGKPWSFIYWMRYKFPSTEHFSFRIGAHSAFTFKTAVTELNSQTVDLSYDQRYIAAEVFPNYTLNKKVKLGLYYLYSKGLDTYAIQNSHFISLMSSFTEIKIYGDYFVSFSPQFFYLKLDDKAGYFISETFVLGNKKLPFAISSIATRSIKSTINSPNFVWNVGINYAFK